jgi:secreted trypsin-like serine protease/uncharacterized membrane protein YphA (DoxX/SURF4 family)
MSRLISKCSPAPPNGVLPVDVIRWACCGTDAGPGYLGVAVAGPALAIRLVLAAVFAVAGFAKLADLTEAAVALQGFGLRGRLADVAAASLPVGELIIATLLVVPVIAWWGAIAAAGLLLVFAVAIAVNLARGRQPDCHCFGQLHLAQAGPWTLVGNVVLAAAAATVVLRGPTAPELTPAGWINHFTASEIAFIGIVIVLALVIAAQGWFLWALFRQNGWILNRLDVLERASDGPAIGGSARAASAGNGRPRDLRRVRDALAASPPRAATIRGALAVLLSFVAGAEAPSAAFAVAGGSRAYTTDAPWTVRITSPDGEICTGVIMDATHVITAAHCAVSSDGTTETLRVRAGISSVNADEETGTLQVRDVTAIAVHPYYDPNNDPNGLNDDVALLTVPPFDFSGPSVEPIALASSTLGPGSPATVTGWGSQTGGWLSGEWTYDGYLHSLGETVSSWDACESNGGPVPFTDFCATSSQGEACHGDSGGGLVVLGSTPELVGIDSIGNVFCQAGGADEYVNVAMPEIRDFLEGSSSPPKAPRGGLDIAINPSGNVATCDPGTWRGGPTYSFVFVDHYTGAILQIGTSPNYVVAFPEAGHSLDCQVIASNAGGSVETVDQNPVEVQASPHLSLSLGKEGYRVTVVDGDAALHLTISDRSGHVRKRIDNVSAPDGFSVIVPFPRLTPGRYTVCLSSDGTPPMVGSYTAGQICVGLRVKLASSLVRVRSVRRAGGRVLVTLVAARPLAGRRVAIWWSLPRRTASRTVVLRAISRLASPPASTLFVGLSIRIPTLSAGKTVYSRAVATFRLARPRATRLRGAVQ